MDPIVCYFNKTQLQFGDNLIVPLDDLKTAIVTYGKQTNSYSTPDMSDIESKLVTLRNQDILALKERKLTVKRMLATYNGVRKMATYVCGCDFITCGGLEIL